MIKHLIMFVLIAMIGYSCQKQTINELNAKYRKKYATGKPFPSNYCLDDLFVASVSGMQVNSFVKIAGKATSAGINSGGQLELSYRFTNQQDTVDNHESCKILAKEGNRSFYEIYCYFPNDTFSEKRAMLW